MICTFLSSSFSKICSLSRRNKIFWFGRLVGIMSCSKCTDLHGLCSSVFSLYGIVHTRLLLVLYLALHSLLRQVLMAVHAVDENMSYYLNEI